MRWTGGGVSRAQLNKQAAHSDVALLLLPQQLSLLPPWLACKVGAAPHPCSYGWLDHLLVVLQGGGCLQAAASIGWRQLLAEAWRHVPCGD